MSLWGSYLLKPPHAIVQSEMHGIGSFQIVGSMNKSQGTEVMEKTHSLINTSKRKVVNTTLTYMCVNTL